MSSQEQNYEKLLSDARMLRQRGETKKAIATYQQALAVKRPEPVKHPGIPK